MSVQFGRWNFEGPTSPEYLERVRENLSPYGRDGETSYASPGVDLLYYPFHTTRESRLETQPYVSPSGVVTSFDGRLDNRTELLPQFRGLLPADSADIALVSAAYERWGTGGFRKLLGDWALSICDLNQHLVLLAKDSVGTRQLYYSIAKDQLTWCTILDPLVLLAGRLFELNEEYMAGWLSFFPAAHLTPYVGIDSVPPSCFVRLQRGRREIHKYWDFDPNRRIHYRADSEYEEHFRAVFTQAVARRLRSDTPVLAELSGGMDSSSIVCVADLIIAGGTAETPRLDTLSYYDDSEPNWNERPYFTRVEKQRGRTGCHIDVGSSNAFQLDLENDRFSSTPMSVARASRGAKEFSACIVSQGNRVLLSGIGGDEVMGGVPTPIPELEDLLARLRLGALAHQLKLWALNKRRPWFHLLFETIREFLPSSFLRTPRYRRPPHWLDPAFARRNRVALEGYRRRTRLLGPRPSFQGNLATLEGLKRQLGCSVLSPTALQETRYPYLDRDLLEFLYAIPREQLVRPGERRSLMRRSLVGIVPGEVLERKRKAFVSRSPIKSIAAQWTDLLALTRNTARTSRGFLDAAQLSEALEKARSGQEVSIPSLMRTLMIQVWLRGIEHRGARPRDFRSEQFSPERKGGEHDEIREARTC